MEGKTIFWGVVILLAVVLGYGFYGGMQVADDLGVDCVVGLNDGDLLCWKWEKNILGELEDIGEEAFGGLTGGVIRE